MSAQLPFSKSRDDGRDLRLPCRVEQADNRPRSAELGRQIIRQLGMVEVRLRLKRMFPNYNRKEIRQLALKLHSEAWRDRDREALHRLLHREEA